MDPPKSVILKQTMMGTSGLKHCSKTGMGPVPVGVSAPHCGHYEKERVLKALLRIIIRDG